MAWLDLNLKESLYSILDSLLKHWVGWIWTIAVALGGLWLGKWRALRQWRKKDFLGRLNISLNILRDGKLLIRTIEEMSLDEALLNTVAVGIVRRAADQTTEANPILPLPKDDAWYILNAALNEVAERFSAGEVRRDMGLPVTTERFVICLTRERAGDIKTQKVRAMLVRKRTLLSLPDKVPELESPNHITRFHTLKFMAEAYRQHPEQFMELDISV